MVEAERQAGLTEPLPPRGPTTSLGPDPEEELARQQRLERARELEQARTAGVFFQINAEAAQGRGDVTGVASAIPPEQNDRGQREGFSPLDPGTAQNPQDQKRDFLEQPTDSVTYSPYPIQDPASSYQVMAGTIIPAALITGINSDLPGQVTAQVTEPVYDTVTGQHLLIPQGTRLIGTYDSRIAFGQERALLVWTRMILPDGSSMVLDNLPGADAAGYAGLADEVDFHTWRLLKGVALATLLGISGELAAGDDENRIIAAGRESLFGAANQVGQEITRRNLDVQPTLTIRPGFPLRVIVTRDLVLRSYQEAGRG